MHSTHHALVQRELVAAEEEPVHERHEITVKEKTRNPRRDDLNQIGKRIGPAQGSQARYQLTIAECAMTLHYDPKGHIRLVAWGNANIHLWVCAGCGDRWLRATVAAPDTPPVPPEEHLRSSKRLLPGMVAGVHTGWKRKDKRGSRDHPPREMAPMTPANPVPIRMDTDNEEEEL